MDCPIVLVGILARQKCRIKTNYKPGGTDEPGNRGEEKWLVGRKGRTRAGLGSKMYHLKPYSNIKSFRSCWYPSSLSSEQKIPLLCQRPTDKLHNYFRAR